MPDGDDAKVQAGVEQRLPGQEKDKLTQWLLAGHPPPATVTVLDGGVPVGTAHWDPHADGGHGAYVMDQPKTVEIRKSSHGEPEKMHVLDSGGNHIGTVIDFVGGETAPGEHVTGGQGPGGTEAPPQGEPGGTAPVDTAPVERAPVNTAPADAVPADTAPAPAKTVTAATEASGDVAEWSRFRTERWRLWWGTGSGLVTTGTGAPEDPLTFPADRIVVPPPTQPAPRPATDPGFATADEEWAVAKESAWNWLVDQMIASSPLAPRWLSSWRYAEPAGAERGRQYELHQSYEAMQKFLNVTEFALQFISPAIIESAMANGLPSRFSSFMRTLAADNSGTAAIGMGSREAREARTLIGALTEDPVTDKMVRDYLMYKKSYNAERVDMKLDGVPFAGFEHVIVEDVNIGMLRNSRAADKAAANAIAGHASTPPGLVWHHDTEFGRMILIPKHIHDQLPHWGGVAIWKRLFGVDYR